MNPNPGTTCTCAKGTKICARHGKLPKITAKQEGGDDGFCYVVRIDGREFINGVSRREVPYYKEQALLYWQEKQG